MPYQYITFAELKAQLAERLDDVSKIFFVDRELEILLIEAMRTFSLLAGFWRQRFTFDTSPGQAVYDVPALTPGGLDYTVTDFDLIEALQYKLLETPAAVSQSSWLGTEMFRLDDLVGAIQRRRNQFLTDTGVRLTRSVINGPAPHVSRMELDDSTIDIRRIAWLGAWPFNYYTLLRREDEAALSNFDRAYTITPDTPYAWSIMSPPPLQVQLAPQPISEGQLDIVTVNSGADLNPSSGEPTLIGIPDDTTPVILWGALADLMGKDGVCRDPVRAQYAEQMFDRGVQYVANRPVVLNVEIQGVALTPTSLADVDSAVPDWQNQTGTPTDVCTQGANLIWLYPVPDDIYSVTIDVVRKAKLPSGDADYVQLGRELLDMILDYAEHLAIFKCAGTEWHATSTNASNFIEQSMNFNRSMAANARYLGTARDATMRENAARPRQLQAEGTGALVVNRNQQGGGGA